MWPSRNNKNNNGSCSSLSKLSSSCSYPSSPGTHNKRSMEEVWQEISLTSLQDHTNTAVPNTTTDLIFQDFFARPFTKDPPPPTTKDSASVPQSNSCCGPLAPHHGTSLSLNCGSGFHQRPSQQLLHGFPLNNSSPFDNAALFPAQVVPSICLKRPQESGDHSSDRQFKRMMKNRESAARSRARKQAYITELELEVAHLEKENATLRRQQEQLLGASGLPKKLTLCRTLTAPF